MLSWFALCYKELHFTFLVLVSLAASHQEWSKLLCNLWCPACSGLWTPCLTTWSFAPPPWSELGGISFSFWHWMEWWRKEKEVRLVLLGMSGLKQTSWLALMPQSHLSVLAWSSNAGGEKPNQFSMAFYTKNIKALVSIHAKLDTFITMKI